MDLYNHILSFVPLPPSILSFGAATSVLCVLYLVYNREATPLRKVPGPFLASLSQFWIIKQQRGLQRPLVDLALHRKYGPIVRVAPNEVIVTSPESRKIIYGAMSKFTKAEWYCATGDCGWSGTDQLDFLPELNMEKYKIQRRLIGGAYSATFMKDVECNLDKILERNITSMAHRSGLSVNIDLFFDYFASDCIQMATFGKSQGFVEDNTDCGAIGRVHKLWFYMHWVGYLPIIHRIRLYFLNVIYKPLLSLLIRLQRHENKIEPQDATKKENIFDWAINEVVARSQRKEHPSHPTDIADRLFQIQAEKPSLKMNWLTDMCVANFNAGVETIGITISTFLNFVMSHPGCIERIQKEIDDARAAETLSPIPKLKQIESLPYLKACLSESRRLHPPLAHPLGRIVPKGGVTLEGYWLPAGTTVGINPWVLNRDKTLYGEDADIYRPERWLELSPEQLKTLDANSLFFGSGTRSCPGQYLAEAIYSKTIPLLLMNLNWRYTEPEKKRAIRATFMTRLDNVMVQWEAREAAKLVTEKV